LFSSFLLLLLGVEFLALSFVIVYVGAIAILFLFIVMMIDIKLEDDSLTVLVYGPLTYFLFFILGLEVILPFVNACHFYNAPIETFSFVNWFSYIDGLTNIQLLGQLLYTHFFPFFLMAGFILFIAILGSLMLTLNVNKNSKLRQQDLTRQISRQRNNSFMVYKY
jgi:NADH-quinone oxidoreductase subunit J